MTRVLARIAIAFLLLIAAAPTAFAQGLPDTGDVTGTAGDVTDPVEGAANDASDTLQDTANDATETGGGTVEDVTDTVNDAAGNAGDTAGDTGGSVTNTVNNATGGGNNGGGSVTDPVTNTINDTLDDVTGGGGSGGNGTSGADEVLGGLLGSGGGTLNDLTPGSVDDLIHEASAFGLSPVAAEGWIDGKTVLGSRAYQDPSVFLTALSGLLEDFAEDFAVESSSAGDVQFSTSSSGSSPFANVGRVAIEAAKTLAFPLALTLLVIGFLTVQGRIGRKDPKLALAPVDTSGESLTFE